MGYLVLGLIILYVVVIMVHWSVQVVATVAVPALILSFFCGTAYFSAWFIYSQLRLGFCLKCSSLKSLGLLAGLCLGLTAIWASNWPEVVIPFMQLLQPIEINSESLFIPIWIWLFVNACALKIAIVWIASRRAEIACLSSCRAEIFKCMLRHLSLAYYQWLSKRYESFVLAAYGPMFVRVNKLQTLMTQLVGTNARPLGIQKRRLMNAYRRKTSEELQSIVRRGNQSGTVSSGDVLAIALAHQELIFRFHKGAFFASQAVARRRSTLNEMQEKYLDKKESILVRQRQAYANISRRNQEKIVL